MTIDSTVEKEFNAAFAAWREHAFSSARYSSDPTESLNCEGFKRIIALGKKALPLVRKACDDPEKKHAFYGYTLVVTVSAIVGKEAFGLPPECVENDEVRSYAIHWLDNNISQYVTEDRH